MDNLTGKTAVITGAAGGLGQALAMQFFKQGCNLALVDINKPGLQNIYLQLGGNTTAVSIHHTDISIEENVQLLCTEITRTHKKIDILVNNAAVSISQLFEQVELVDYRHLIDVNFWGTVYCTKYFLPYLKLQQGKLVNIISDFALMGFPGKTTYSSSKAAVMAFSYSLHTELAAMGVKVSVVIPPPMATGIVMQGKHMSEEKRQKEMLFLKKHGMPVDKAAYKIVVEIRKGRLRIVIGFMMRVIDTMSRLFPSLAHKLIAARKDSIEFI